MAAHVWMRLYLKIFNSKKNAGAGIWTRVEGSLQERFLLWKERAHRCQRKKKWGIADAIPPLFSFSPEIFLFSEEKRKRLLTRLGYPRTRRFSERKSPSAWNDIVIPRSTQKFPKEISVSAGNCFAIPCSAQIFWKKICEREEGRTLPRIEQKFAKGILG